MTSSGSSRARSLLLLLMLSVLTSGEDDEQSSTASNSAWPQQFMQALQECEHTRPLGMITGEIEDWQITSSSIYPAEWDSGCDERFGRVYQPDGLGWCAKYKSASEWIQVDLGVPAKVTGFMTQGRADGLEWVTSFMVSHSVDGYHWQYVTDVYGNQKVFEGNSDSFTVVHIYVEEPFIARYVKFHTVAWQRHPSMRVEIVGCQVCNEPIALPPYGKISSSSDRVTSSSEGETSAGGSCHAEDGYIVTNKAWCAKYDNGNQWLQFDVGPPTLVTGLVTKGRGDGSKKHWVSRYRLSYSNDSQLWFFYKEPNHLDVKHSWEAAAHDRRNRSYLFIPDRVGPDGLEFGGNSDRDDVRYHYLTAPFVARFIRFHPVEWNRHISMRAGLLGCPYKGNCKPGFMRINDFTPCVENLAFRKESWINNRRQLKRHIRNQWLHGHAARAVDGVLPSSGTSTGTTGSRDGDSGTLAQRRLSNLPSIKPTSGTGEQRNGAGINSCTVLDNFYVDRPIWMVDIGRKVKVSGVVVVTWTGKDGYVKSGGITSSGGGGFVVGTANQQQATYRDYMYNLDKLVVYADNSAGREPLDLSSGGGGPSTSLCGFVSRLNDALFKPSLLIQCKQPIRARYVYVEAWGVPNSYSRLFSAVLCEVMVYE